MIPQSRTHPQASASLMCVTIVLSVCVPERVACSIVIREMIHVFARSRINRPHRTLVHQTFVSTFPIRATQERAAANDFHDVAEGEQHMLKSRDLVDELSSMWQEEDEAAEVDEEVLGWIIVG